MSKLNFFPKFNLYLLISVKQYRDNEVLNLVAKQKVNGYYVMKITISIIFKGMLIN